jgi:putative hydroxymethylpyrimidine transporter CytX
VNKHNITFLSGSLLWFGAAISLAEILAGTFIAPLGFGMGMLAIVIGHAIGCTLLYFAGLIGAKSNVSSMESVRFSFGRKGSIFFSILNILQLVGWTAVMIFVGASALGSVENVRVGLNSNILWCVIISVVIIVWVAVGLKHVGKLNIVAVGALFAVTAVLGFVIFNNNTFSVNNSEYMTFGLALELSIAMPISWLPLISDYTRHTSKPIAFTLTSTISYFVGSCLMYIIGLGSMLTLGNFDIVNVLMNARLELIAVIIIVLSTVTTAYLDVYSAGESLLNITKKFGRKTVAISVCIIGAVLAALLPVDQYQNFLYLIGSVFAPMVAILITDYFILKKRDFDKEFDWMNAILWVVGFIIYRIFLQIDTIVGSTVPVVIIISVLCIVANKISEKVVVKNV